MTVRKRRQQVHAQDVRGLVAFSFCPLEEKIVNKSCFPSIFKPLVKKLKLSTLAAKSDLRFKVH